MNENLSTPAQRYDALTVKLHWATAILVVLLWGSAQIIDLFAKGPPRWNMLSVHMLLGLVLAVVLVWRVLWRTTGGVQIVESVESAGGALYWAGRLTHISLYLLIAAQLLLGLANAWVRGDHVFTWFVIPAFDATDKVLRRDVGGLHELVANLILIVAGLHAAAALFHHYVLHDNVLRRMLPKRHA